MKKHVFCIPLLRTYLMTFIAAKVIQLKAVMFYLRYTAKEKTVVYQEFHLKNGVEMNSLH